MRSRSGFFCFSLGLVLAVGASIVTQEKGAESTLIHRLGTMGTDTKNDIPPKRIVIPRLNGPVEIDGRLTEPVWKNAAVIYSFIQNDGTKEETERTELRLFYDADYLYLGWICTDSDIQGTMTQRDSNLWEEEVVECFLAPQEPTRYFELEWNPLGTIFDAMITNYLGKDGLSSRIEGDRSWDARNMKSIVVVEGTRNNHESKDKEWRVEIALPFSDLNVAAPKSGDCWRGNFYRYNRTFGKPLELVAWSPTLTPSFHEPNRFGYIEFGERGSKTENFEKYSLGNFPNR